MKIKYAELTSVICLLFIICFFSSCNKNEPEKIPGVSGSPVDGTSASGSSEREVITNNQNWGYIESGDYEKAVEVSDNAIKSGKGDPEAYSNKIYALLRMGRRDEALKVMNDLNEKFGDNKEPELLLLLGNSMIETGDYPHALENFKKIIDMNSDDYMTTNAYKGMGRALLGMEKYQESIDAFTKAIETSKMYVNEELYIGRSSAYTKIGEDKKAVDDVKKAAEIAPDKGYVYLHLGYKYMLAKQEKEAVEALEKAKELDPDFNKNNLTYSGPPRKSLYYHTMAHTQIETGDYKSAIENCLEAIKSAPDLPQRKMDILVDMGLSYYIENNREEAVKNIDEWLGMNPPVETEEDLENMATAKMIKGKSEEALKDINKAIKERSDKSRYYLIRGLIYQSMGDKEKAEKGFKEALAKSKREAEKLRAEKHLTILKK